MPRYFQDTPAPARDGFKSFDEITHFLTKVPHNEWRQFQSVAHSYLNGTQVPKRKLKKSALYKIVTAERGHHLLPELHGELQSYYDQEDVGGGITETLSTLGSAVGHLFGMDWLAKILGITPSTKVPQTLHSELIAWLTKQTYTPLKDRRSETVGYTRLEKYDNERFSVYQNDKSKELVVCVSGTKLNMSDVVDDMKILMGMEPESAELDKMLDQLEKDFPGVRYDMAAHSLGTMFVYSEFKEHRDNMNDIYFFNPASSPLQNTGMLQQYGNDPSTWYFVNQGDIVSNALYQQMNPLTFDTQVSLGPYVYSPLAAHSLSQWFPDSINLSDDLPPAGPDYDNQKSSLETEEFGQDTEATQAAGLS